MYLIPFSQGRLTQWPAVARLLASLGRLAAAILTWGQARVLGQDFFAGTAPMFSGIAVNTGQQITLADYRGKVVFVDFWASWCPPCLASLLAYNQMRQDLDTSEFEIIAINVDENTEDGLEFLADHPVDSPVLADADGKIGIPYGVRTLPRSYLLDREARIIATYKSFKAGDEVKIKQEITALIDN